MNDKKILEEVYRRVVAIVKNGDANVPSQVRFKEFKDFIEQEWQKADEEHQDRGPEGSSYDMRVN